MNAAAPRRPAGFTLIEMLIVLAILGLLLAVVVPRITRHNGRLDIESAAQGIAQSLRLARGQAIARDRTVSIAIGPRIVWPAGVTAPRVSDAIAISGPRTIDFTPDGSSSGGTVALLGGGRRVAVEVNWLTGQVAVLQGKPTAQR